MNKILTGIRTTGSLHLGHYIGALKLWKKMQDEGKYQCFFLLADLQALTTHTQNPEMLKQTIYDITLDWLSIGLDPKLANVNFVLQSQVKSRYQITTLFQMIAKYNEVMRNPTLKSELKKQKNASIGFMVYPVDQVADIFMISSENLEEKILVPVGEDQSPHIEYANDLTERFNKKYQRIFGQCQSLVGEIGRLVGIDGQNKMSKSLNNTINLNDSTKVVKEKVFKMYTDPNRIKVTDPGTVINNPVFIYHDAFNPNKEEIVDLKNRYLVGKVGDVEVKQKLFLALENFLQPIRERRNQFKLSEIKNLIVDGTEQAEKLCSQTVRRMQEAMKLGI